MGAVAPNGNGIQEFISNSFAGKVGIKAIKKFDAKPTGITVAGEIDDFDPNDVIRRKAARRMDLYSQYALQSVIEAMKMMTEIKSPFNGIITSICVSNEELVEVEQPLFSVQEDKDND